MAIKKEYVKGLFTNTRTRMIIIFTAILVVAMSVIGVYKLHHSSNNLGLSSDVIRTPNIKSIPGALKQTAEYATLQETQNIQQAQVAEKTGQSAIPTIIRSQAFGSGVKSVGAQGGEGSVGFETLARQPYQGPQSTVWFQDLKDNHCSRDSLRNAVNQGAVLNELKLVCTCAQLKDNSYGLMDLKSICPCPELKAAGFTILQFKVAGYSAEALRICGFVACEERAAGFSAEEMKAAGYSDGELAGSGFTERDIARAGGLPDGVSLGDVQKAGCSVENLKRLRMSGVTAAAIRRISGCSAAALRAAGYTADDLKKAGFSAAELRAAGFSPEELRKAGYSARELLDAGFSPEELKNAGFSSADILDAESILPAGITSDMVRKAGCDVETLKRERLAGVSAYMIKKLAGCSAAALKAAGFSEDDLLRAGLTPEQLAALKKLSDNEIKAAGCDPAKLRVLQSRGVDAQRIQSLNGCSDEVMRQSGFGVNAKDIKAASCDPAKLMALRAQGVTAKQIHELNGCSADALRKAGYGLEEIAAAGFTPAELLAAGFTPEELAAANLAMKPAGVIAAGRTADCSVASLKAARAMGVSATEIKRSLGCSAAAMRAAGYTAAELKEAGYTAAELKAAGFSAAELKAAGFSAKDLRAAGFSAAELKAAGFSAKDLRDAGFSAAELKAAGFSAKDLRAAGFSADELKAAGFGLKELKDAGFDAAALAAAGFSVDELKKVGFLDSQLKSAGLTSRSSAIAALEKLSLPESEPNIPSIVGEKNALSKRQADNAKKLEKIMAAQKVQMADQRFQQKVQQRASQMMSAASQALQEWKNIADQTYLAANNSSSAGAAGNAASLAANQQGAPDAIAANLQNISNPAAGAGLGITIKMGDIVFAVIDTSINSDEPGPILATVVSGPLKGSRLIGAFNLPANSEKMVISFNSLSVPGTPKTMSIAAFAIDPNTARTALSSETDHHYLSRYGALFASTFLEGFGNAFQSADTTITIGGTGGTQDTTVQNGIGRSALENAVIGLANVGKAWGQVAQQNMSRPTTVQVFSGTGVGVLFTQDVTL